MPSRRHLLFSTRWASPSTSAARITSRPAPPGSALRPDREGREQASGPCAARTMCREIAIWAACPSFIPATRESTDPADHRVLQGRLECSRPTLGPGLTSTEMNDAAMDGRLKALYIIGEDPVVCDANVKKTRQALESLDFLVVQEIFMTPTARMADVVLPAAAWAEKDGSYTSMETARAVDR